MNTPLNRYRAAHYLTSSTGIGDAPPDQGGEVAFAGRSNAGKSSAINALTDQRALARTSKQPGRTQLINYFAIDAQNRLVDLPGYGYAKVPEKIKRRWQAGMENYLRQRQSLSGLVVVMDIRHPLTQFDCQLVSWCQEAELPYHLLLTKADKIKRGPAMAVLHQVEGYLQAQPNADLGTTQLFSALKRTGIDNMVQTLDQLLVRGEEPKEV